LKNSAHFFFEVVPAQRVFNFRRPALAYDTALGEEWVISYSKIERAYVLAELERPQNRKLNFTSRKASREGILCR